MFITLKDGQGDQRKQILEHMLKKRTLSSIKNPKPPPPPFRDSKDWQKIPVSKGYEMAVSKTTDYKDGTLTRMSSSR